MVAQGIRQTATSNNIANASTPGYKRDIAVTESFSDVLTAASQRRAIGTMGMLTSATRSYVDLSSGTAAATDGQYDLAIMGEGFFAVETEAGVRYTRAGNFRPDAHGWLVTPDGARVLGEEGHIRAGLGFAVAADGTYYSKDEPGGKILIVAPTDYEGMTKAGGGLFDSATMEQVAEGSVSVVQGVLESSNVNVVQEMVDMITGFRIYEAAQKAILSHDAMLDAAVNQVGKMA